MAEKKAAKTAQKRGSEHTKQQCAKCGSPIQVMRFAGFGSTGLFWVPEGKDCGESECPYPARTK
jgi:hypothetical protein